MIDPRSLDEGQLRSLMMRATRLGNDVEAERYERLLGIVQASNDDKHRLYSEYVREQRRKHGDKYKPKGHGERDKRTHKIAAMEAGKGIVGSIRAGLAPVIAIYTFLVNYEVIDEKA